MEPHYITIKKTARYYTSGPLHKKYKAVCFALHGYGQLAAYFNKKLQASELDSILFVVPEGLHRFYLQNSAGRVGASWMTKEDRLNDIEDYCLYLDQLRSHFKDQIEAANYVGILAFSQGVATGCRWLAHSAYKFDFLVNWAGAFPPDLNFEAALEKMRTIPVWLALGDADEYISEEQLQQHLKTLQEKGFSPQVKRYKGEHRIYIEPLVEIFNEMKI
jgi:predicted esterase